MHPFRQGPVVRAGENHRRHSQGSEQDETPTRDETEPSSQSQQLQPESPTMTRRSRRSFDDESAVAESSAVTGERAQLRNDLTGQHTATTDGHSPGSLAIGMQSSQQIQASSDPSSGEPPVTSPNSVAMPIPIPQRHAPVNRSESPVDRQLVPLRRYMGAHTRGGSRWASCGRTPDVEEGPQPHRAVYTAPLERILNSPLASPEMGESPGAIVPREDDSIPEDAEDAEDVEEVEDVAGSPDSVVTVILAQPPTSGTTSTLPPHEHGSHEDDRATTESVPHEDDRATTESVPSLISDHSSWTTTSSGRSSPQTPPTTVEAVPTQASATPSETTRLSSPSSFASTPARPSESSTSAQAGGLGSAGSHSREGEHAALRPSAGSSASSRRFASYGSIDQRVSMWHSDGPQPSHEGTSGRSGQSSGSSEDEEDEIFKPKIKSQIASKGGSKNDPETAKPIFGFEITTSETSSESASSEFATGATSSHIEIVDSKVEPKLGSETSTITSRPHNAASLTTSVPYAHRRILQSVDVNLKHLVPQPIRATRAAASDAYLRTLRRQQLQPLVYRGVQHRPEQQAPLPLEQRHLEAAEQGLGRASGHIRPKPSPPPQLTVPQRIWLHVTCQPMTGRQRLLCVVMAFLGIATLVIVSTAHLYSGAR
ncbi:hypothetical protein GGR54DRAFT_639931 [Hypoxylon sp. NC1633]|nr:hypothetical protein GGR54DRAFT_639931 [Hypoxylon sp. NC1633]